MSELTIFNNGLEEKNGILMMSSNHIAMMCEKRHDDVIKIIRKTLESLSSVKSPNTIESRYYIEAGDKNSKTFWLDEGLASLIAGKYNDAYALFVNDKFIAMKDMGKRDMEILQSMNSTQIDLVRRIKLLDEQKIEQQTLQIEEMKRTKAHVTEGREGALFSKTGVLTKKVNKLEKELEKATKPKEHAGSRRFRNAVREDLTTDSGDIQHAYGVFGLSAEERGDLTVNLKASGLVPVGKNPHSNRLLFRAREVYKFLLKEGYIPTFGEIQFADLRLVN